jgi:hypothetical protein
LNLSPCSSRFLLTSRSGMMAVTSDMFAGLFELVSLVWMELAMIMVASLGYTLFHGFPLASAATKKAAKIIADEGPSEEDLVSQDLQKRLAEGDHRAVYKLWQRAKSFDMPSGVPLSGIVESMQKLGKETEAILREFRTAMECNEALFNADAVQTLLETLRKDAQCPDLVTGLAKIFEERTARRTATGRSPKSCLVSL